MVKFLFHLFFNYLSQIDFTDIQLQLSNLLDILERIKINTNSTTASSVSSKTTVNYSD